MACVILGTVVHSYLYATSYVANILRVKKRRHLFSSYRRVKASRIRAGDFPETRAPPVAPVSRREPANSIHSFMFILLV